MQNGSVPPIGRGPKIIQYEMQASGDSVGEGDVLFLRQRLTLVVGVSDDEDDGDGKCDQQDTGCVDHHTLTDEQRILLLTAVVSKQSNTSLIFSS